MEYLNFPKMSYNLTQGFGKNSYSHKYCKALDISGYKGSSKIYAPFTGYVGNVYVKKGNAYSIWLVSEEKVMCADGVLRYAVVMMTHPEGIEKYKKGFTFIQGEYLFDDGKTGNATGAHLDLRLAVYDKKENISLGWHFDGEGYDLDNSVNPCDYMTISDEVKIINQTYQNKVYKFKNRKDINVYTKGLYRTLDNVRVRCGAGLNFRQKKVKELTPDGKKHSLYSDLNALAYLKKGTYFDALEIIVNASGVWAKGYSGYINIKSGKYINSEKV